MFLVYVLTMRKHYCLIFWTEKTFFDANHFLCENFNDNKLFFAESGL